MLRIHRCKPRTRIDEHDLKMARVSAVALSIVAVSAVLMLIKDIIHV